MKDLNKNITDISYNSLHLPGSITVNGATHTYVYAADGRKLRVVEGGVTRDYVGNLIYENGSLKRILFDGGYIEGGVYHFYLTDYLGNVSTVADATGNLVQQNRYYPFGLPTAETGNSEQDKQPYKYNGKEQDNRNGLNWYDYGARMYDPALCRFLTMDPLAEKYYGISPYAYCLNNPVRFIDPTGEIPTPYEAALMAKHVYGDKVELTGGWTVSNKTYELMTSDSGFKSGLYERTVDGVTEYALATAGTELGDWGDIKEDITQLWGETTQYKESAQLAETVSNDLGDSELTFVGHSLGGGLATVNALATDRNAITFNPAAVTSLTKENLGLPNETQNGTIVNVVVRGEIVDYLQSKVGLAPTGVKQELKASYLPVKQTFNTVLRMKNHMIDTVIRKLNK